MFFLNIATGLACKFNIATTFPSVLLDGMKVLSACKLVRLLACGAHRTTHMVLVGFQRGESSQTRFSTLKLKYSACSDDAFQLKKINLNVKLFSGSK